MSSDIPDDLRALLALARAYLETHEDVRRGVEAIGRALTALANWSETEAVPRPAPAPDPIVPSAAPTPPAPPPAPVPVASLPPLTFAPLPTSPPHAGEYGPISPQPLTVIAARCRLKAEACRFVVRRIDGSEGPGEYADLTRRAHPLPDCFLWMLDPRGHVEDARPWVHLANAFETAAEAAEMFQTWDAVPEPVRDRPASDVLHLAAEAQAVLYSAVAAVGKTRPDNDQVQFFVTIREEAARLQVYIRRYLRKEDRGDPTAGPDVSRRVREQSTILREYAGAGRNRQKALANLKYKTRRLQDDPTANAEEWPRVAELLGELVAGGLPPSNPDVRDALLPILDRMPDDLPLTSGAKRILDEVDQFLANRPPASGPDPADEAPSAEVEEVRRLLIGREVVLIGGQLRPQSRAALIEAFALEDLRWIVTPDHESVSVFEAPIARPEVAVVLLAIRWSSHSYGDVQHYCDRYGKLLVRLPGGYNPNQVAHQILEQAGHRLRAAG